MGCVASRIDKEERVQTCRERKRLMKQVVRFRAEFADAQLAYLKALKNTGVTLRQFTESESLELDNAPFGLGLPPSPPPPLPPAPPPPPPFSPDARKFEDQQKIEAAGEETLEFGESNCCTPLPPTVLSSPWDFWDPFDPSPMMQKKSGVVEQCEDENWAETKSEFEDEDKEEIVSENAVNKHLEKVQTVEQADDNSSVASWHTQDTADMPLVVLKSKKTLANIIKDLDDYFLKASYAGKEMAVIMDMNGCGDFPHQNFKDQRRMGNSAKVFSALSWSWSSKSFQLTKDTGEYGDSGEPCRAGAHCITLEKIYAEERRLYKEVKEEEITKLELQRKTLLLQRQEDENYDPTKTEKTRASVESLQSEVLSLHQSISRTCSSILKLLGEELHPQLDAISRGLIYMWRTMYECHQVQVHISQQLNNLNDLQNKDPTTSYHQQATAQLQTEVTFWFNSFCKLMKSQEDYIKALCRWVKLTRCLVNDRQENCCSSVVHTLCEGWQLTLDRVPHKVASEAIRNLVLVVQSIISQQAEEHILQRKCDKLQRKWQKESQALADMEMKLEGTLSAVDDQSSLSLKHPLVIKRAKTEALKKQLDAEKAKHLNSIHHSWAMTLTNLQTSLPNVFRALSGFSSACSQALESLQKRSRHEDCHDGVDVSST